jgi:hypothetical protein
VLSLTYKVIQFFHSIFSFNFFIQFFIQFFDSIFYSIFHSIFSFNFSITKISKSNHLEYGSVDVNATINSNGADPYGPITPNSPSFWAPPKSVVHATYSLSFDRPYLVERVKVQWKVPPPQVEIQMHT